MAWDWSLEHQGYYCHRVFRADLPVHYLQHLGGSVALGLFLTLLAALLSQLFQKCCLVQRILEAWEANDNTQ